MTNSFVRSSIHRVTTSRKALACGLALTALAVGSGGARLATAGQTAQTTSPLRHGLVFSRFLPGADQGEEYRINAGGTTEASIHAVYDAAILSTDGTRLADVVPTPDGRLATAIFDLDGSNYHLLPPADPTLQLGYPAWSANDSRIASQGWDDGDPSRAGIYSRRSSDGQGLLRLTDSGTRTDYPITPRGFSPDGSKLLFFRPDAKNETSDSAPQNLFVVGARGGRATRLTPPGITSAVVFSFDSVSWSPDGSHIAVAAAAGPFWTNTNRSVYLASTDGSSFRRIGPRGDIWDAVWSPDGRWIAFTMATKATGGLRELYVMHPDGSGMHPLTSASDGLFSLQPVWSRDSRQLLFLRGANDVHQVDLWSINVGGSRLYQVTHTPAEYRGVAWLP
jgi:Tol biopolymer transport system component